MNMAAHFGSRTIKESQQQVQGEKCLTRFVSRLTVIGKYPHGIKKRPQRRGRKIERLETTQPPIKTEDANADLNSTLSNTPGKEVCPFVVDAFAKLIVAKIPQNSPIPLPVPPAAAQSNEGATGIDIENQPPIEYWRQTGKWPQTLFEPDPNMSQPLITKRSWGQ